MTDEERPPRPGTTASLEARVGRLETQYDRLDGKVDDIAVQMARLLSDQHHLTQLIATQHQAITAEVQLVRSRVHDLSNNILTVTAEPEASPAGRALAAALTVRDLAAEKVHADLAKTIEGIESEVAKVTTESRTNRLWIAGASAVVAGAIFLINLFAPAMRGALNLP